MHRITAVQPVVDVDTVVAAAQELGIPDDEAPAAGSLFAYAWHAFTTPPAFDTASVVIVRISEVVFAAVAVAAVWVAGRRLVSSECLLVAFFRTRPRMSLILAESRRVCGLVRRNAIPAEH
jgi:hypothetical protein